MLVPVGGDKSDEDTAKLACQMAKLAKKPRCQILVLYVIQVQRSLPLDATIESDVAKGEQTLRRVEDMMADCNGDVDTDILQAREIGVAIVDEAVEKQVDLIIMGAGYKKRFGTSGIGPTVLTVLRDAPCRVLVVRPSLAEGQAK